MFTGVLGVGVFIFTAGLVLMGFRTLLDGSDRTVGWVLVSVGVLTAGANLLRLFLVGPW
jgi:hypothetical protein